MKTGDERKIKLIKIANKFHMRDIEGHAIF